MMTIRTNPTHLTIEEKHVLATARNYTYIYGTGIIIVDTNKVWWDCTDTVAAKQYLDNLNIKEIK